MPNCFLDKVENALDKLEHKMGKVKMLTKEQVKIGGVYGIPVHGYGRFEKFPNTLTMPAAEGLYTFYADPEQLYEPTDAEIAFHCEELIRLKHPKNAASLKQMWASRTNR